MRSFRRTWRQLRAHDGDRVGGRPRRRRGEEWLAIDDRGGRTERLEARTAHPCLSGNLCTTGRAVGGAVVLERRSCRAFGPQTQLMGVRIAGETVVDRGLAAFA